MEINSTQDLLNFFKKENCSEFTSKGISQKIKSDFNVPKTKTLKLISELKEKGIIERRSESGNCKTTCASCYEYGCDADQSPPINFWKVLTYTNI